MARQGRFLRKTAAIMACALLVAVAVAGCGGGEGVDRNATLSVYVSAPLSGAKASEGRAMCAGAGRELARAGGRAGSVELRVRCLDDTGGTTHWTLAAVGANARKATEDSASIGYIGELDPAATRFSQPILEAAGIPQISDASGEMAMAKLLSAIRQAGGSSSLRPAVLDGLAEG